MRAAPSDSDHRNAATLVERGLENVPENSLAREFLEVRQRSLDLCAPLELEDYGVQPMADASPPKWHLAHTAWFFETFLLQPFLRGYQRLVPDYEYLFNSYYNGVGEQFPRTQRGNLSRPTVAEVRAYRHHVDAHMLQLLSEAAASDQAAVAARTTLGIQHEQQHQELLLTDLKYNLGHNPLHPAYHSVAAAAPATLKPVGFCDFDGGIVPIGAQSDGFCFDNELPRHDVLLRPFALANRVVSNGEYLEFVEAGGYQNPDYWLSSAWSCVQEQGWRAPLYWRQRNGHWYEYQLGGLALLDSNTPVCHLSFYEADAYARFRQARLPTEFEWEHAANEYPVSGNFVEQGLLHPQPVGQQQQTPMQQLFGDVWEWTASSYAPFPGYRPLPGTLGEYNGKFMSEQLVLRGGSCFSAQGSLRSSYRNFFYAADRWQMSGLRLAQDC